MGKVDDQRAMREARYAANNGSAVARRPTAATRPVEAAADQPARTSHVGPRAGQVTPPDSTAPGASELCGHRNMGNKGCTRERGHEATGTKNHRYG